MKKHVDSVVQVLPNVNRTSIVCNLTCRDTVVAVEAVKVRPHGQKFSRRTWYNMVVRHKTCRGSADGTGNVCRATFYVVRPIS